MQSCWVEWCREVGDSFQAVPHYEDADDLITLKGIQVNISLQTTLLKGSLIWVSNKSTSQTCISPAHKLA